MSLKELAQEALDVQNACNLSGVAQSFARVLVVLGPLTNGTEARNAHPIVRVYLDKMVSLAGASTSADWNAVFDLAKAPSAPGGLRICLYFYVGIRYSNYREQPATQSAQIVKVYSQRLPRKWDLPGAFLLCRGCHSLTLPGLIITIPALPYKIKTFLLHPIFYKGFNAERKRDDHLRAKPASSEKSLYFFVGGWYSAYGGGRCGMYIIGIPLTT
jgi:hypothetical protein